VSAQLRRSGVWEPFETALILQGLRRGDVFVDIGANIGYFTILAASQVGEGGRVFCFEPDPLNTALLRRSVMQNSLEQQTRIVQAGLSNRNEAGVLHLSEDNFGDHQTHPGSGQRKCLDIELLDGGEYLSAQIDHIDLIKIDVQGAEFKVVQGLLPFLKELPVRPDILLELTPYSLKEAGSSGRELIDLLAELDKTFFIVDHIEHQLVETSADDLRRWCDNVDSCAGDRGFMNIILGSHTE